MIKKGNCDDYEDTEVQLAQGNCYMVSLGSHCVIFIDGVCVCVCVCVALGVGWLPSMEGNNIKQSFDGSLDR